MVGARSVLIAALVLAWFETPLGAVCLAQAARRSAEPTATVAPADRATTTRTTPPLKTGEPKKRKPTLLPAAKRRTRYSLPPQQTREVPLARPPHREETIRPTRLPPARDVAGDRGAPLGLPGQYDPRVLRATPPTAWPPLPPARQVPGETGIPLGPGPLSPETVR